MCADTEKRCGSFVDSWRRSLRGVGLVAMVVAMAAVCVTVPAAEAELGPKQAIAFQSETGDGDLWIFSPGGQPQNTPTGLQMMEGTSPSINNFNDVAFQANTGSLWIWTPSRAVTIFTPG